MVKVISKGKTSKRDFDNEPHAYVLYLDSESNKEIVPACNIPEITPPVFDKNQVYDVFWAPDKKNAPVETLPEARKRLSTIPRFEAGAGYGGGLGFYPATILHIGMSRKELEMALEATRLKEPSGKALEALSTISSKSSGIVSDCSAPSSRKRAAPGTKHTKHTKVIDQSRKIATVFSDEESDDQSVIPEKLHKTEISKMRKLIDLNMTYQKHMLSCCKVQGNAASFNHKVGSSLPSNLCDAVSNRTQETEVLKFKDQVSKPYQKTIEMFMERKSKGNNESKANVSQNKQDVTNEICYTKQCGGKTAHTEEPNVIDEEVTTIERDPQSHPDDLDTISSDELEPAVDKSFLKTVNPQPQSTLSEGNKGDDIKSSTSAVETEESSNVQTVDIYKGVSIAASVWNGAFKDFVLNPLKTYTAGSKGDREFIKDATNIMWKPEELLSHSVTGKPCNVILKKAKEACSSNAPVPIEMLPALEDFKVHAILGALIRRVEMEKAKEIQVPDDILTHEKRKRVQVVRRYIGEARSNIKKVFDRKNGIKKPPCPKKNKTTTGKSDPQPTASNEKSAEDSDPDEEM